MNPPCHQILSEYAIAGLANEHMEIVTVTGSKRRFDDAVDEQFGWPARVLVRPESALEAEVADAYAQPAYA
jgi:hypothetical protein